jgi:hypothetical protein
MTRSELEGKIGQIEREQGRAQIILLQTERALKAAQTDVDRCDGALVALRQVLEATPEEPEAGV